MNEQLTAVDSYAAWASKFFTDYPAAKWLLLSWVVGWVVAFIVRPFIRMSPLPDKIESHLVVLSCMLASGVAAGRMWFLEEGWNLLGIVSVVMGGTSILGYLGLAAAVRRWLPSMAPHLSLQKDFTAAVDDEPAKDPP